MDIEKRVEQALENLDMMSKEEADKFISEMDKEFARLLVRKLLKDIKNSKVN